MHLRTLSLPQDHNHLTGKDLILYEPQLAAAFGRCFAFTTHALRFPTSIPHAMLPQDEGTDLQAFLEDDRIHIPLQRGDDLLGIFVAGGIDKQSLQPLLATLPGIAALALETVGLYRAALTDPLTGLHNPFFLQTMLEAEMTNVLSSILPGPESSADTTYRSCLGLIHVDMDHFSRINTRFGYGFGDSLLQEVAKTLQSLCPSQASWCRVEGTAFMLCWPEGTPSRCRELAHKLIEAIAMLPVKSPIAKESISLTASAGYASYPADMPGNQLRHPPREQASILLAKIQKATLAAKTSGGDAVFAYKDILKQGAAIIETLPLQRVRINAGRNVDLTEGMRFLVWPGTSAHKPSSQTPISPYPDTHKGEIIVQEVRETTSVGEILFLNDPSWSLCAGDRLSLSEHQEPYGLGSEPAAQHHEHDNEAILNLGEFIAHWTRMRTDTSTFTLALCRMLPDATQHQNPDQSLDQLHKAIGSIFSDEPDAPEKQIIPLTGRYSANTLICFLPRLDADNALDYGRKLAALFTKETGIKLHIGMAAYPLCHYTKPEMLDNVRKALEHSLLLPEPGVVLFDSISLTINADRMFTQGDYYAAREEYQRALGIDPDNLLARNSLGICYARLGRMEDAKKYFKSVAEQSGKELMPLYNYGCACFKTHDADTARKAFTKCLTLDPTHVYSLIRLGRLAEQDGDLDKAEELYQQAGTTPQGKGMAARHLARLALEKDEQDKARELLHQALVFDPNDAFALNMLARLYLDRGEDPEIAENLARQSVHLRPDVPGLWIEVARALETCGKKEKARSAHRRSKA